VRIQSWSCHQPTALRRADNSRLVVRASAIAVLAANCAASRSPAPASSSSASGTTGGSAPRRARPYGTGLPMSGQAQLTSEIWYTRRDAPPSGAWPR